ncbi:MAG: acyltransferase domain-containing protein, partial [Myxococcota bacterium]|nr:acyltransferase domain-containing protein [Myxococcota bacterium]
QVEIARRAEAWSSEAPRRAGISSFGFGGTNCHLIIEEPPQRERAPELSLQSGQQAQYLVMLSAPNRALLQGYVETLLQRLPAVDAPLRDIAFTLSATRSLDSLRAAIIVDSKARLLDELEKLRQALAADGAMPKQLGKTILIAQVDPVAKSPRLALMFPGQGSQRVGLLRSCYERFPAFKARFDALAEVADDLLERPLHSFLYPEASSPEELEAAELALQETRICQPALGVLGLSLLELFEQMGLEASLSMGHSLGEFVGTAASKALSAEDAIRLVGWRGKLMSGLELEDNGQMAAVMSDVATVRKLLESIDGVAVANVNQASQTVISGTTAAMEQALSKLAEASISAKRLRVSHAFHSPIMQAIRPEMEKVLAQLSFTPPALPLVSAARGQLYPAEPGGCRELLAAHATEVVDFVNALQLAKQSGAELFLEMGAGSTLTTFAKSAGLPAIQLASAKDDGDLELMRAIAQLLLLGVPLNLRPLFEGADVQVLTLPATPILREQYLPFVEKGVPVRPNGMDVNELPPEPQAQTQAAPAAAGSEQLLALFREQTEVLRAHAGILAQQTAILAGTPLPAVALAPVPNLPLRTESAAPVAIAATATPEAAAPAASAPAAPSKAKGPAPRELVLDAVAGVSAFPRDALRAEQKLASDLGFDSLMFVDLAAKLQEAFPSVGALPQSLLSDKTTVGDIVAYIEEKVGAEQGDGEKKKPELRLRRFAPVPLRRPRAQLPTNTELGRCLVVVDSQGVGEAVIERLLAMGLEVVAVRPAELHLGLQREERLCRFDWPAIPEAVNDMCDLLLREDLLPDSVINLRVAELQTPIETISADDPILQLPIFAQQLVAGLRRVRGATLRCVAWTTGIDGCFGLLQNAGPKVWQVGLSAFAKSLSREWPDTRIRVCDMAPSLAPDFVAEALLTEILGPEQDIEVGYSPEGRFVIGLEELEAEPAAIWTPRAESVILVGGGGRGLGAKAALELAQRYQCRFILAGRSPREQAQPS